jgi:hypothetical protein
MRYGTGTGRGRAIEKAAVEFRAPAKKLIATRQRF